MTTVTTKAPEVGCWHVPPENQGQMVEVAYGVCEDGYAWCWTHDRSDGSDVYRLIGDPTEDWNPWNVEPSDGHGYEED